MRTLYILYNADSSILGKLKYGYRKLSKSNGDEPACAACDITHGGLSLSESQGWVETKKEIEQADMKVVQWHRDEISDKMRNWLKANNHHYPAVLLDAENDEYTSIMTPADLSACKGDPKALLEALRRKEILSADKPSSSL